MKVIRGSLVIHDLHVHIAVSWKNSMGIPSKQTNTRHFNLIESRRMHTAFDSIYLHIIIITVMSIPLFLLWGAIRYLAITSEASLWIIIAIMLIDGLPVIYMFIKSIKRRPPEEFPCYLYCIFSVVNVYLVILCRQLYFCV